MFSCSSKKPESNTTETTGLAKVLEGKVLVTLLEGKKVEALEADFTKYSLKHKSVASRSQNQHLFTFDKNLISAESLLKKLNKNKKVFLAEPLQVEPGRVQKLSSGKKQKAVVK